MTTKELEELLEGGIETPHIDYKGPCEWDINTFAKDILAMANIEGGGRLIIGVAEKGVGYERVGMAATQIATFNYDNMRDQFASYAAPNVKFSVAFPEDKNGLHFVVITVDEFDEIPVICIKSNERAGTKAPVIYYRNTDKKIESGQISNYHDLRNLIERSAIKIRDRWKHIGLSAPDNIKKALDEELGKINMTEEILNKIKSRGYWRINFRPLIIEEKLELPQCKSIVEKNNIEYRGWYYPHVPRRSGDDTDLVPGNNYYEGWIDWGAHKEIWRMYQSGQFIHYKATEEDWYKEDDWYDDPRIKKIEPGTTLSVISAVYLITEIFEFLSRLTRNNLYQEGVEIDIGLNKTANRKLVILDPMRVPLFDQYMTKIDEINFTAQYSSEQMTQNAREEALKVIIHIFHRFGWENPPIGLFKSDQEKLITRKF